LPQDIAQIGQRTTKHRARLLQPCDSAPCPNRIASELAASGEHPSRRMRRHFFSACRPGGFLPNPQLLLRSSLARIRRRAVLCLSQEAAMGRFRLLFCVHLVLRPVTKVAKKGQARADALTGDFDADRTALYQKRSVCLRGY
jgi:hypothetical protein